MSVAFSPFAFYLDIFYIYMFYILAWQTYSFNFEIFKDFFYFYSIEIDENTTAEDIEDWDSLNHITLIDTVESEFGLRFTMGEVSGMKNVGEMAEIIKERGKKA